MTTSGITSNQPVRDELVLGALRLIGAYDGAKLPRPERMDDARKALNLMLKSWQTQNGLWLKQFVKVFLVPGQTSYSLPGANGAVDANIDQMVLTSVSGTALVVDDTTGVTAADVIGVELDDGSYHWDVVASVDSSTGITLTTGTAETASAGNQVWAYPTTAALYRPTRIFGATRITAMGVEAPLNRLARDDYRDKTAKTSTGTPVEFYYDPQLTAGKLYVWPAPTNVDYALILDVDRPLQIMVDSTNTYDIPMEWQECLKYGLAIRLAPEYSVPLNERQLLEADYSRFLENIISYNTEHTSVFLQPGE